MKTVNDLFPNLTNYSANTRGNVNFPGSLFIGIGRNVTLSLWLRRLTRVL